jgi:hypothetical protein
MSSKRFVDSSTLTDYLEKSPQETFDEIEMSKCRREETSAWGL